MRNAGVLGLVVLAACAASDGEDFLDSEADGDASELDDAAEQLAGAADSPVTGDALTSDVDEDGIADALEEMMLRRYRPYYRWTAGEEYGPSNPFNEIANAQLKRYDTDGNGTSDPLSGCGRSGDQHLDPPAQLLTCRADTTVLETDVASTYCLNFADARYAGVSIDEAATKATGLYGHVTPSTVNGHDAYQIEYWQFFPYNSQDISLLGFDSFGDHEGDWTSVQLWYDRVARRLAKIRYLIHGKEVTFTIPAVTSSCRNCFFDVRGKKYNPDPGNVLEKPEAYSDNAAQFFIDDKGYRHVVAYIERGGHEMWPGAWGHAAHMVGPVPLHLNGHKGDGKGYLVPDTSDHIFNLGEVGKPLTRTAKLMVEYNGLWGCTNSKELYLAGPQRRSPVGPALHCSWNWLDGRQTPGCSI